ncbi:hypothetical protein AB0A74_24720 [Saccharothrix sp. NPDC042600]|uniref:hypothetical protein n=1 Tax=Saccharothrix TaxID=2071 RepID=UPI0033CFEAFD|nr:hypothetical protein GCM10017745_18100 [Saccharothrix mutabilis subsp. capreolus]
MVEQGRVRRSLDLVLGFGELTRQLVALGPEFGSPLVDVADERLVDVVGDFEGAYEAFALALVLGLGDGAAEGDDLGLVLLPPRIEPDRR